MRRKSKSRSAGQTPGSGQQLSSTAVIGLLALAAASTDTAVADEGGVSYWLPGEFGSLSAAPLVPGWAVGIINVYESVSASGNVAAAREVTIRKLNPNANVNLNLNLSAHPELVLVDPAYVFATKVFGGQLAVSMGAAAGRSSGELDGILTVAAGPLIARARAGSPTRVTALVTFIRRRRCAGTAAFIPG
jgi:hypothetical protein